MATSLRQGGRLLGSAVGVAVLLSLAGGVTPSTAAADSHQPRPAQAPKAPAATTPLTDFSSQRSEGKAVAPVAVDPRDAAFSRGLPPSRSLLGERESAAGRKLEIVGLQDRLASLLEQYEAEINGTAVAYEEPSATATAGYLIGFPLTVVSVGTFLVLRSRRQQTSAPSAPTG